MLHENGTSRVREAAEILGVGDIIIVQGDEPLMRPDMISELEIRDLGNVPISNKFRTHSNKETLVRDDVNSVVGTKYR